MKINNWGLAVTSLVLFASSAFGQVGAQDPAIARKEAYRKVIAACKKLNDSRPAVHACVKQFHENVKACMENAGVKQHAPGEKISDFDVAALKKCHDDTMATMSKKN